MATSEMIIIIRKFAYGDEQTISNLKLPDNVAGRSIKVHSWNTERHWYHAKAALEAAGYTCELITTPVRRISGVIVGGDIRAIIKPLGR